MANLISKDPTKQYEANIRESGQGFSDADYNFDSKEDLDMKGFDNIFDEKKPDIDKDRLKDEDLKKLAEMEKMTDDERKKLAEKEKMTDDERKKLEEIDKLKKDGKIDEKQKKEKPGKDLPIEDKEPISIRNLFADFIGIIARLQNFNISYENGYGTIYENRLEIPGFGYQIGLPTLDDNEIKQKNYDNSFDVSSGFPLFRNLSSDFRYSTTINKRYASASNQMITTTWPDIRLTLTNFESLIGAQKYLNSSD